MIKASLETRNFSFCAYGMTTSHAMNALIRGLKQQAKDYGIESDWFEEYSEDIQCHYIKLNRAYRDSEIIKQLTEETV